MNIIGKWNVKKVGIFDMEEGLLMKSLDELKAMEQTEEIAEALEMGSLTFMVANEETLKICMMVPAEAIEEARAAGEEVFLNEDGSVTVQEMPWKEENGELFYLTSDEGEIDGEAIDPWQPLNIDEDGLLVIGVMGLEKE